METILTTFLDIEFPIFQGAMAWVSYAKLAAAVFEAGSAGIIATSGLQAEQVRTEIRRAKELTNKPFCVNMPLMVPNKDEIVDVICEEKVAFITLGAGNPVPRTLTD